MEVTVNYGLETLESRNCRIVSMPDGHQGAVWRGQAFALNGCAIDVSEPGVSPAFCGEPGAPAPASRARYALRPTVGGLYLFLSGSVTGMEQAALDLARAGLKISRTGRYLGEAIAGFDADWFIRIDGEPSELPGLIAASLGAPAALSAGEDLRGPLIARELERALEAAAAAKRELETMRAREGDNAGLREALSVNRDRAEAEKLQREAAETRAREAQALADALLARQEERAAPNRAARGLAEELDDVLKILLPRIRLTRDSREVATVEFASRQGLYKVLSELDREALGIPQGWKSVRGASPWIESHVSTGRNDQGRAYARHNRADRTWEVLISFKASQPRDMDWLRHC